MFAGGDFVTGASNVTTAMAWGKEAARNIDHHLSSEPRYDSIMPVFSMDQTPPEPNPTPTPPRAFPAGRGAREDVL